MESNQLKILDLNDYCLGHVLKYLDTEDHVHFAHVCTRFREVLKDWSYVLYPEYTIKESKDESDADNAKWQLKLFGIICDVIRKLYLDIQPAANESSLHKYIDHFCKLIQSMENLEYFAIHEGSIFGLSMIKSRVSFQINIDQILAALQFLPKFKSVSVRRRTEGYKAISLIQMKCLQEVSMDTKIASEDLVEICKSNKNLRTLWLREVVGDLNDIVPHCQNLAEIAFVMFKSHNSYAKLAELPQLRKVIIKGTNSTSPCAKSLELFSAFAAQKQQTKLESLILFSNLDFEETSQLIELKFLKELRCSFDDAKCIDLLTDLTELEGLYIMLGRSDAGSKECLNILKSCKKLERLHINSNLSTDFVAKALEVLRRVRNPEKQKPLQLYSTGMMHLCSEDGEKLVDNAYCTLVHHSEYLRPLPWRFSN